MSIVIEGVNLEAVRRFLSHESIETTKTYLQADDEMLFKELGSKDHLMKISGG